jgi:CubicO group peptidase (beta-lactamase class C family)
MKNLLIIGACFIFLSCQQEKPDPRIHTMDEFLQGQVKFFKFNGNVLVAERGKVIYKKSFGLANYDDNLPLNDSSIFELASVSKQFTAAGILLLQQMNKLSLTDSLRHYFPELPYTNITLHHMLTHTSGLPDYEAAMNASWDRTKIAFNQDMIAFLAKEKPPIHFKPGEKWEYSNTAFAILASTIEKVSGQTFKEFMAQHFFQPLGMKHTLVYNTRRSGEKIDNYAYGYVWSDSLNRFMLPDSLPDYKYVYYLDGIQGDGIINSTTADLLKWDRSLRDHTILNEGTVGEMKKPHALVDTVSQGSYGYGVFIGKNQFGNYIQHAGGWPGYGTNLARYVDDDLTLIVLSNNESAATAIQAALSNIFFNQPVAMPYEHTSIVLDSTSLDLFAGSYKLRGNKFTISRDKIGLKVYGDMELKPESETKIFHTGRYDLQFEIEKDANGNLLYYRVMFGVREPVEKLN